jgi:hypothetical protein
LCFERLRHNTIFLSDNEVFGLIKTSIDAHTLGISLIANLLRQSGYKTLISDESVSEAATHIRRLNNWGLVKRWVLENSISRIGFSYRLDPDEGKDYFLDLYYQLKNNGMFIEDGGTIRRVFFAGLPDTCKLIQQKLGMNFLVFSGGESPQESLKLLGVPSEKWPNELLSGNEYDIERWNFAKGILEKGEYLKAVSKNHSAYTNYGLKNDLLVDRIRVAKERGTLPIIRAHVGPYSPNRKQAIADFINWGGQLAKSGYLDVLSIGTSQLTQARFEENWDDLPNGGGVPINSRADYARIWVASRPMLVRTYAGTKNVPYLAAVYEKYLNIAWHALSFWWFCETDGRGENSLLENLQQHFETIKYIASISKPLEANVPHHFAFRGGDDVTYILSAYLTAKLAKKMGIKYFILQNMLNTPKYTWGIQDLAKGRTILKLIRELEDDNFKMYLQTRAGLDYFSPDYEKAKIQLAAVTALMDDIEPLNDNSPDIIHVVSYSEAIRLADPVIINESIKIVLDALDKHRLFRKKGQITNMLSNKDVVYRFNELYEESKDAIHLLESNIQDLYSPSGFYKIFCAGFLSVPYLIDSANKYPHSKSFQTQIINGGVKTVDNNGNVIPTTERFRKLLYQIK